MAKKKKLLLATACAKDANADFNFYLKPTFSGHMYLACKNKKGQEAYILSIDPDGVIRRTSLEQKFGLQVDAKGRIKIRRGY